MTMVDDCGHTHEPMRAEYDISNLFATGARRQAIRLRQVDVGPYCRSLGRRALTSIAWREFMKWLGEEIEIVPWWISGWREMRHDLKSELRARRQKVALPRIIQFSGWRNADELYPDIGLGLTEQVGASIGSSLQLDRAVDSRYSFGILRKNWSCLSMAPNARVIFCFGEFDDPVGFGLMEFDPVGVSVDSLQKFPSRPGSLGYWRVEDDRDH